MTPELKSVIRVACAEAMKSLGPNYKGMSCFLYSWHSADESAAPLQKAA